MAETAERHVLEYPIAAPRTAIAASFPPEPPSEMTAMAVAALRH